ncbi:MAG: hypothetical protein ACWIPJ_08930, partial [Polaribacter sp.]
MFLLKNGIKGNYLQHIRSYSFLLTVAAITYLAFSFIPSNSVNYSTIKFGSYTGSYNSAWIGFVTAIMSSIFLSLFGFFLINGSIKKDIDTRIGHIIGTTRISNYAYIFTKVVSNFFVLLTLLVIVFLTSIGLFFLYGKGYNFIFLDFIKPYLLIAIPSLFLVVNFSIILEVIFPKKGLIQYGIFLFVFFGAIFSSTDSENIKIDFFGIQQPTKIVEQQVKDKYKNTNTQLTIGIISGKRDLEKTVTIVTPLFSNRYILSRILLVVFSFVLVYIVSLFFHRFNSKERKQITKQKIDSNLISSSFKFKRESNEIINSTKLLPLICIELVMMFRKNPNWAWLLTIIGMSSMFFLPISVSHNYILPLTWFLQISIWSNLVTKDTVFRTHYFTNSSYKPVQRLFVSRIFSGIILALFITIPLLIRLIFNLQFTLVINVILGALFITLLAVFLGVLSKGSKLFEIIFFFLVYSNLNLVSITDYFGAINNSMLYTFLMLALVLSLFLASYF